MKQILEKVINVHGASKTAETLDDIKAMGYKYSTRAAMTVSISDMTVPASKPAADRRCTGNRRSDREELPSRSDHRRRALQRSY